MMGKAEKVRCDQCGSFNVDTADFCIHCGVSFDSVHKNEDTLIKCPKCGVFNRPGSTFCADCGRKLKGKRSRKKKKRKIVYKLYKESKGILKSAHSQGIRKTALKETGNLIKGIDKITEGEISKRVNRTNKYGYMVCEECNLHYVLKRNTNTSDLQYCSCGGKLHFSKNRCF